MFENNRSHVNAYQKGLRVLFLRRKSSHKMQAQNRLYEKLFWVPESKLKQRNPKGIS